MSLTPGLLTVVDLFHKLQRDAQRLNAEITSDSFFDFVVTGYSIIDWIKNDPAVPASAKTQAEVDSLYESPWGHLSESLAPPHFPQPRLTCYQGDFGGKSRAEGFIKLAETVLRDLKA